MRRTAHTLILAAGVVAATSARAQIPRSFDLERLQLDPAARGSLVIGDGEVAPEGTVRISLSGQVQHQPLVLLGDMTLRGRGQGTSGTVIGDEVKNRLTAVLTASAVVTGELELYLRVPVVAWQNGDDISALGLPRVAPRGMGTPSLGARVALLRQGADAPLSVAAALELLPALGKARAIAGGEGLAIAPRLEIGHRYGRFVVGAEGHAVVRGEGDPVGPDRIRNEVGAGLMGASTGRIRCEVSLRGASVDLGGAGRVGSAEVLGGFRAALGRYEIFALAGPGFGSAPGTPAWRGLVGLARTRARAPAQ